MTRIEEIQGFGAEVIAAAREDFAGGKADRARKRLTTLLGDGENQRSQLKGSELVACDARLAQIRAALAEVA